MAAFPTLTPSSRTYTPGGYPQSAITGMSGVQGRVRNSNVMLASQLRLTFAAITEAQMLSILAHYQGQRGGFQSFLLPTAIWNAVSSVSDYQLTGYGWVYTEPPAVTDAMCADAYDVELTLQSVPPEGTALLGLNSIVRFSIAGGVAQAANGASLTVTTSIEYGAGAVIGLAESVAWTLAAGSVTLDAAPLPLNGVVNWALSGGQATANNGFADGFALTITATLAAGNATGEKSLAWDNPNTGNPGSNAYRLYAPGVVTANSYMRLSTTTSSGYKKDELLSLVSGASVTIIVNSVTHVGTIVTSATLSDAGTGTERIDVYGSFTPALSSTTLSDGAMTMISSVF